MVWRGSRDLIAGRKQYSPVSAAQAPTFLRAAGESGSLRGFCDLLGAGRDTKKSGIKPVICPFNDMVMPHFHGPCAYYLPLA